MPRVFSFNARKAFAASQTGDLPITLVEIKSAALAEPVRFSSDPTERITTDPLAYGTRSNGKLYDFVLMSAVIPDDIPGAPPAASIVLDNVTGDMAKPLRAVGPRVPVFVDIFLVFASAPDTIEETRWLDLRLTDMSFDALTVALNFSHEVLATEPYPSQRMTRNRAPGLFR
jgi:hypothetical protein